MRKLRRKLHRFLFPKEAKALEAGLRVSFEYMNESPVRELRRAGDDIYTRMVKHL